MLNHTMILRALRTKAASMTAVTSGAAAISATGTGYNRVLGSFITDGFTVGQEVVGVGFATGINNGPRVIGAVTDTDITCPGTSPEAPAAQLVTVGLPFTRAWENIPLNPIIGQWYVEEDYIPGPVEQITLGEFGELEALPMYVVRLYGLAGVGNEALYSVADGLLSCFAPRTELTLTSGDVVRVRTKPAPYRGQLQQADAGRAVVVVTIPCRIRAQNII